MGKRVWKTPHANLEKFVANEYVAACWAVVCTVPNDESFRSNGNANDPGRLDAGGQNHRVRFCGNPNHYQIELDDNGVPVRMIETQTDKLGDLPCTITESDFATVRDITTVKASDYLYWTTSSGSTTWRHEGAVTGTTNHS